MRQTLLKSRVFDVERRAYEGEDGRPLVRDIIVHPGAVVILPVLDAERLVMIRNYRHAAEQELLELPAGTLEPGEAPLAAAARELEEETGYAAGSVEPFIEFFTTPGMCTELMRGYVARDLKATAQRLERGERIRVEVVSRDRARRGLWDGTIRDGKTIAVLAVFFLKGDVGP